MAPLALLLLAAAPLQSVDHDIVYLKQGGAAFTMDAFRPAKPNGDAVIFVVSGGWYSDHKGIDPNVAKPFTDQGITVFEVVHGTQPRYKIPEIEGMIARSIRYVRANAAKYGVSPTKVGIFGGSAGGHLSLMTAVAGSEGKLTDGDSVDAQPSKPNAIVAFFPPTDMANFGGPGKMPLTDPMFLPFRGAFPIKPDATAADAAPIAKALSPIYGVDKTFPPTLLIHGDKDMLVPLEQSQRMDAALAAAGVEHKLIVVPGAGHGLSAAFAPTFKDVVEWFLKNLK